MFAIKVIAVISMLIDHFGLYFFPDSYILHILGRIAFPLFAWLIANGARHTRNIDAYLKRLFIFAVISQLPYYLSYYEYDNFHWFNNVVFTLFLGLLAIRLLRATELAYLKIGAILACAAAAFFLNTDYGAAGVLSIAAFYLFYDRLVLMLIAQTLLLGVLPYAVVVIDMLFGTDLSHFYYADTSELFGLFALLLIFLYDGTRGPRVQYFFYWFFPLQSLALLIMSLLLPRGL